MEVIAMGAVKDAKSALVACGAPDCEKDHKTYDCRDVVVLTEGMALGEAEKFDVLQDAEDKRLCYRGNTMVFPTVLGIWFEAVCEN